MVKTKKIKILSVLLVGIIALFAVAFLSVVKKGESVYAAEVSVSGIRTEYLYKDTVNVPKTALNECGEYSVVYEKTVNGKRYNAKKTFSVKKKVFELTSGSESISYGTLNAQFAAMGYTQGLKVGIADGYAFTLNKPFNIYENNLVDLLSFNCMQTEPTLCNFITLRLTDCYDPSVYLDITYKRAERYYNTTIVAGTCGGKTVGLTQNEQGNVKVGDKAYEIDKNGTTVYGNNPSNGIYSNLS